jgi:UDP-N-acetylmuramoylalanine--D-glutamate ligase
VEEAGDDERVAAAAKDFGGLPSRCHSLGTIGAVEFVDDSLSTNVLPAQAALEAFADRAVALLVGGHDRGVDYAALGATIARRAQLTLVVTMPNNGPRIGAAVREAVGGGGGGGESDVEVIDVTSLEGAVETAYPWVAAAGGGVVLLSPAAPSFGGFADYRERAAAFAEAAARLGELG